MSRLVWLFRTKLIFDLTSRAFRAELRDLVDSHLPQLPPDDPSSSFTSTQSGHIGPSNAQPSDSSRRKRSSRKERNSSLAQREMVRLLANEEAEAKSMRKYLRAALDRLDGETRRAQEAERRALEIAERFRVVNEARQTAQNELTRVSEELRLWRNQFENAQRELLRARDVFKELEEQRNSAESDATRYRTLARQLNEERLINKAREEGRKEGYEEGLKRGMEQGRTDAYNRRRGGNEVLVEDDDSDTLEEQTDPAEQARLDQTDEVGSVADSIPALDIPTMRGGPLRNLPLRGGTQFHEHFTPASTVARSLPPVQEVPEIASPTPQQARMIPPPARTAPRDRPPSVIRERTPSTARDRPPSVVRDRPPSVVNPPPPIINRPPSIVHNRPPSIHHPESAVPPDNWIPPLDPSNNSIPIPPPHEFITRTGSPYSDNPPLPIPAPNHIPVNYAQVPSMDSVVRDVYSKSKSSPPSITESLQSSSNVSQFEILAPTRGGQRKEKPSVLDRIDEVSSSMEYSPGFEKKAMPAPVTFPVASGSGDSDWGDGSHGSRSRKTSHQSLVRDGRETPRSRSMSQGQRQAEEPRYSNTSNIDNWRRESATLDPPKHVSASMVSIRQLLNLCGHSTSLHLRRQSPYTHLAFAMKSRRPRR